MGVTRGQAAIKQGSTLIGIDILGLPEIAEWMKKSPELMRPVLRAAMHASVLHVKGEVQKKLNNDVLKRRTGLYHKSINTSVRQKDAGRSYLGIVGTHVKYARVHEFGATIRPKKAGGYLWFRSKAGGLVRAKEVTIPARPVWRPAFEETQDDVLKLHQQATLKMLRKAGKNGFTASRSTQ